MVEDSHIIIRAADISDAPACAELSAQLGYGDYVAGFNERFQALLIKQDHALFVATENNIIRAWMHIFVRPFLERPDAVQLASLVVDEECRSKGIGKMMLAWAEEWARGRGVSEIMLLSNVKRERAHAFYLKNNYMHEKTTKIFSKPL